MKRIAVVLSLFGVFVSTVFVSHAVHAQTSLSEAHIEHIRQNCVAAQTTLTRIQTSDKLLRVNRGRLYEIISTKLMAPLNSRIALERFEGLKLAATTIEYDRQRDKFTENYKKYDDAVSRVTTMDCTEKPVEFYETLQKTREYRQDVHEDTEALTILLTNYKTEFEHFASEFEKGKR